ncbi:MAG: phosphatase PAP2 family protein [Acholeplasmatales bacterium]|nr:phosphatase PAP2 family protein [Acholeplasmatales bacterium]
MKKLLFVLSILICLSVLIVMTYLVIKSSGAALSIDAYVRDFAISHRGNKYGIIYWIFRTITEFAEPIMVISIGIMFLLYSECDNKFLTFVFGLLLAFCLNEAFKETIGRARPNVEHFQTEKSNSFPSTHSVISAYIYTAIPFYVSKSNINKRWKKVIYIICPIIILAVMLSRIVMGVHYFSDVIAGTSFGLLISLLMMPVYVFLHKHKFLEDGVINAFKNKENKV